MTRTTTCATTASATTRGATTCGARLRGVAMNFALVALALVFVGPASAQPRYRVDRILGASAETHALASVGTRTFVATSGGLVVREGGRVVRTLTTRDGLPGARLRSLSSTPDALYVGALEGLAEVDATTLDVKRTWAIPRVRRVIDFAGARWFLGYEGLHRLEGATPRAVSLGASHARERLTDALVVGDELYVASAGAGVLRVSAEGRVLGRFTTRSGLADDTVHSLAVHEGDVLVATFGGVSVVRGGRVLRAHALGRASERLPVRDVRAIASHDGALFVAVFGAGVHRLGPGRRASADPRRVGDGANEALTIAATAEGLLIGHRSGLAKVEGSRLVALGATTLPSADVTALARAFGALYVGTFDRGLVRVHDDGRVESLAAQLTRRNVDGRINDLAVTTHGETRLWIATDRGLYWYDGRRFAPVDHAHGPGRSHVTSLHVDPRGELWVTSSRVLARWRGGDRWESFGGDTLSVAARGDSATNGERFSIAQLHAVQTLGDDVWVGSLHGLYRLDPRTGHFERHTVSSGALPVDWVTALASVDGALVAGTYHGGLAWKQGARFSHETERDGLPAGWVNPHAIEIHEGAVHIGTLERGLLVGRRGAWRRYTIADGLPSDDVTAILPEDGGAWIGTRGGLVWMARVD